MLVWEPRKGYQFEENPRVVLGGKVLVAWPLPPDVSCSAFSCFKALQHWDEGRWGSPKIRVLI